jgi:hypothetical protein
VTLRHTACRWAKKRINKMAGVDTDVDAFLHSLPSLIEQAHRRLYSRDLNVLEHMNRNLGDALNVIWAVRNRCLELNAPHVVRDSLSVLLNKLRDIFQRYEELCQNHRI